MIATTKVYREELSPVNFLERAGDVHASRIAAQDGDRTFTYREWRARARRLASALRRAGLERSDRVAFLALNSEPLLLAHAGVPQAGGIIVAINTRLAAEEVRYIVEHSGARFLFYSPELAPQLAGVPSRVRRFDIRGQFEDLLATGSDDPGARPQDEEETIAIDYTSGTTGRPKGVMYTHRGAYLNALAMGVVDDPYDFGRIAATNALSDVYAMGARPILALALVGMPVSQLPVETIRAILAGGAAVCAEAGLPIAGGHSIDSVEPIYGLVALGLVHPQRVMTNRTARAGDVLILGKALGVGILSAAFKQERLDAAGYAALVASTTQLNSAGPDVAALPGVHAMTDVTGFGLLGHALEMARGAGLTAEIFPEAPAILAGAEDLARAGVRTGASTRNWASYGGAVRGAEALADWRRDLLCDPQTSGGLLIAAAPDQSAAVLQLLRARGFAAASVVGRLGPGPAEVQIAEA